jgi:hypothetical protein
MSSEKIYAGSGRKVEGQYGTFRKISVCLNDIPKEHINDYNGKKYVSLLINDRKEADKFGKDLSVVVDTYKPEKKNDNNSFKTVPANEVAVDDSGLPF